MNKLINWWNNTKIGKKKMMQWHENNNNANGVEFPEDKLYQHKEDIPESDWLFSTGDICERYVTWFFYTFTHKCIVKGRAIQYRGGGSSSPFPGIVGMSGYCAGYKVTDLDDDNRETDSREVIQSFLSK